MLEIAVAHHWQDKKLRLEDAINATKAERPCPPLLVGPQSCSELQAAVDEGIVPGGGAALSLPRLTLPDLLIVVGSRRGATSRKRCGRGHRRISQRRTERHGVPAADAMPRGDRGALV